jgi:DNA-binding XRE family transcriptional regulator
VTAVKRRAFAQRRQLVGHSQETLARILGVEPTTVGRWERGETSPQPWCRPKLADALGVSLEELDTMLTEGQSGPVARCRRRVDLSGRLPVPNRTQKVTGLRKSTTRTSEEALLVYSFCH